MDHVAVKKPGRKTLKRLLLLAGVAIVLWLAASYAVAYRMTRRPHAICAEPAPSISWGVIEAFRITTADQEDLGAWFIPGDANKPLVLLLHGNGCNRGSCLDQAKMLAAGGSPVLLISLRAHGDSTGEVNDFGYSARRDVTAAVAWLERKHPGRPVLIWGRSLGAAAALFAAEELGERVKGYILECPYQDLPTAVWNRTRVSLPPVADVVAYAGLRIVSPLVLADVDRISPLEAASGVPKSCPVLTIAGGKDRRARPEEARAICDRIGAQAKLIVIEEGEHLQLGEAAPEGYRGAVQAFLTQFAP